MWNPAKRTGNAAPAGQSRSVELAVLIGVAALSFILACAWINLSRKVGRIQEALLESRSSKTASEEELSTKIDGLTRRMGITEESLRGTSTARLEGAVSKLRAEVDAMKFDQKEAASAGEVKELRTSVRALKNEITKVKELAEAAAAKKPEPLAAPAGASSDDIIALTGRVDALRARVDELGRKKPPSGTSGQVNEEALRTLVNQLVKDEVTKVLEAQRDQWRPRRPRQ